MKRNVKESMFRIKEELDMFAEDSIMITIQRKDLELLVKEIFFKVDEWSNQSAMGYAITAAEAILLDPNEIEMLVGAMQSVFDSKTLEKAADLYRQSSY